ncbi:MAG: hypothetical protein WC955_05115 [Elusimicrobiota bacterium]
MRRQDCPFAYRSNETARKGVSCERSGAIMPSPRRGEAMANANVGRFVLADFCIKN